MYTFEYPPHSILDIISRTPLSISNFFPFAYGSLFPILNILRENMKILSNVYLPPEWQ